MADRTIPNQDLHPNTPGHCPPGFRYAPELPRFDRATGKSIPGDPATCVRRSTDLPMPKCADDERAVAKWWDLNDPDRPVTSWACEKCPPGSHWDHWPVSPARDAKATWVCRSPPPKKDLITIIRDNEAVASIVVAAIVLVALGASILRYRRERFPAFVVALTAAAGFTLVIAIIVRDLTASATLVVGFSLLAALGALLTFLRSTLSPPP